MGVNIRVCFHSYTHFYSTNETSQHKNFDKNKLQVFDQKFGVYLKKMDKRSALLLFTLVNSLWARPQFDNEPAGCSRFYKDSTFDFGQLGLDERTVQEKLVYDCVDKSLCTDGRDFVAPFSTGSETLLALIDTAQNAACPEQGQICCSAKYINVDKENPAVVQLHHIISKASGVTTTRRRTTTTRSTTRAPPVVTTQAGLIPRIVNKIFNPNSIESQIFGAFAIGRK